MINRKPLYPIEDGKKPYTDERYNIVREHLNILDIIGEYTKLAKRPHIDKWGDYIGKCPIPQCESGGEHTLIVNSDNGMWACFKCRRYIDHNQAIKKFKSGNVLNFIAFMRSVNPKEAINDAYEFLLTTNYDLLNPLIKEYEESNSNTPSIKRYHSMDEEGCKESVSDRLDDLQQLPLVAAVSQEPDVSVDDSKPENGIGIGVSAQVSCRVGLDDKKLFDDLSTYMSKRENKRVRTSTIIRALIRLGSVHRDELVIK